MLYIKLSSDGSCLFAHPHRNLLLAHTQGEGEGSWAPLDGHLCMFNETLYTLISKNLNLLVESGETVWILINCLLIARLSGSTLFSQKDISWFSMVRDKVTILNVYTVENK